MHTRHALCEVMDIGVISDTHNFFDPQIPRLFAGVEHILHGGDIGLPPIIFQLEEIAPVTAVLGNTDDPGLRYRLTETIELEQRKFLLHHIVNPHRLEDSLLERISRDRPAVVVFGHSHKPFCESIDGTLYFNPGYAGKSRFGMKRTLAILHCQEHRIQAEYLELEGNINKAQSSLKEALRNAKLFPLKRPCLLRTSPRQSGSKGYRVRIGYHWCWSRPDHDTHFPPRRPKRRSCCP